MLERVSAALTKFLSPLTSSINNSFGSDSKGKEDFQRFKGKPKKDAPKAQEKLDSKAPISAPHLKLVPTGQPEAKQETLNNQGFTSTILDLFSVLKDQHTVIRRWGGAKTYESSLKSKSMSQLRKGTIFDEKAD